MANPYRALKLAKLTIKKKKTSAKKGQLSKKRSPAPKSGTSTGGTSRKARKSDKSHEAVKSYGSMAMAVDASRPTHIPPPIPLGPYTVLRGRTTISINTSTTDSTVVLLGPHTLAGAGLRDLTITSLVATSGVGNGVPGASPENYYTDVIAGAYASSGFSDNKANGNLHGLTIVLNCLSPTTTVQGQVYVGSLNQRINRLRFSTYNELASSLINRREVQPHSAYNILASPVKFSAYPVDIVDWARQVPLLNQAVSALADNVTLDSLSQLVVVMPATSQVVSYSITVYTEWRMNFADSALASTATTKQASDMGLWSSLAAAGSATSGFIQQVEGGVAAMGALSGAISAGGGLISQLGFML